MWHWFPENVSTFLAVDSLFTIILWITGIVFVLVEVALLFFAFKYRHKEGRRALHVHGNLRLEAIWTGATFLIVLFIAGISIGPWMEARNPDRYPPSEFDVLVTAKQFEWNVTYAGADRQIGTDDDITARNQMRVPVNRAVHVTLAAEDVIHSFFLPSLRVKQDAVPGMTIPIWFEATKAGEYVLGCAELCGLGHYRMRGVVHVLEETEFDNWYAEQQRAGASASGAETGSDVTVASAEQTGSEGSHGHE